MTWEKKRVALVTGSSKGIGFEIARMLATQNRDGADSIKLIVTSRDQSRAETAAHRVKEMNADAIPRRLDVTNQSDVDETADWIRSEFGRLDILVNNSGIRIEPDEIPASRADLEIVRRTIETNLMGAWRMCKACIPIMKEKNYGRIVNISSGSGGHVEMNNSKGLRPAYRLSKAALNSLTILLAAELRGTNILINAVNPGWTKTDMGGPSAPRNVSQAADTPYWLATLDDDGPTGCLFQDRKQVQW